MDESKHIRLNEAKWDKWSETADEKGPLYDYLRRAQSSVISLTGIKENMTFLDIGCGTGWAVGMAARAADYKGSFYGVDLSTGMIEKAKKNFQYQSNIHFIQANSESIPLENDLFDIIVCTNSFHHYLHPDKSMKEIYRLLKIGGKAFILDPTSDSWLLKVADKIIKIFEPQHVKMYSTEEFKSLMSSAGLNHTGFKTINGRQKVQTGEKNH